MNALYQGRLSNFIYTTSINTLCLIRRLTLIYCCSEGVNEHVYFTLIFTTHHDCLNRPLKWLSWRHDLDTVSTLQAISEGKPLLTGGFTKGNLCGDLMYSFLLASTSCWTNSLVGGDLRRHNAHVTSLWSVACMTSAKLTGGARITVARISMRMLHIIINLFTVCFWNEDPK